jgi:CRP-like cAMP-binding protein/Fe-S-cluster-containing dehydrogenase component
VGDPDSTTTSMSSSEQEASVSGLVFIEQGGAVMTAQLADEWTQLLKQIPFLAVLPETVIRDKLILGKIPQAELPAACVAVPEGEFVIREGEFGDTFFVVLSGTFAVETWNDEGLPVQLAKISRGAYFGEMAMIGRGMRTSSVKAASSDCQVLEIYKGPFDRMLKEDRTGQLKKMLDDIYARKSIEKFVRDNEFLRVLQEPDKQLIVDNAKLQRFEAMAEVYRIGAPATSFFFVKQGFLKVWRTEGEVESILAYLRDKDFFGDLELIEGRARTATVTAMEPVETIELPRSVFATLYQRYPNVIQSYRKYDLEARHIAGAASSSKTGIMFAADLIGLGVAQARSALIIDMDLCVRCGNCVQACSDLHDGYSRLIRRGKKLTRRERTSGQLQNLFFPNSCLHCRTPDCMAPCPVGSIARDKDGEVYIKDHCVGCGGCAKACEFGNISMVIVGDKKAAKPQRKASKCDICRGYEAPNCVYNCPQGAIVRIDPTEYFEELRRSGPNLLELAQKPEGTGS